MEHQETILLDRRGQERNGIHRRQCAVEIVQQALGGQGAANEARPLEIRRPAPHRLVEHRVAHMVFVILAAVNDQVVRVEMKTHVGREIGQEEDR